MKILVTGAGGLVGSAIVKQLNQQYNIYTTEIWKLNNDENHIVLDLTDKNAVKVLSNYGFDVIVHCAAIFPNSFIGETDKTGEYNRKIDDNILTIALENNLKMIFISSVGVYGTVNDKIVTEEMPLNYNSSYAKNKAITENLLKQKLGENYFCARLTSPFGYGQKTRNVMKIFIDRALDGGPLIYYGKGNRTQNFVDVRDIAYAVEKMIISESSGIYNIAGSMSISMRCLAETVAECAKKVLGKTLKVISTESPDTQEQYRSQISIEKAKIELGWEPVYSITDGIEYWLSQERL